MGLFSIFKKGAPGVEDFPATETPVVPQIDRSLFVDDSEPIQDNTGAGYLTRMPIDAIYAFINRDYEQKGYDDAMCDIDGTYKDAKKEIIRNELKRLFQQVTLAYKSRIRDVQTQVTIVTAQGLTDTAARLKSRLETYTEHLEVIKGMEEDLDNGDPRMLSMIECYERGFRRGLAAKSNILLGNEK